MKYRVYIVTTIRLTPAQKRKVDGALKVIEGYRGRRLSRGEVVAKAVDVAMRHRDELADEEEGAPEWRSDPIFDRDIGIDMGKTDGRTVKRLLYGMR